MIILREHKLIRECQKGNKEAFNELITFYYPYVYKFLLKLTGNPALAEDLLQDTFIKLIKNIDKYQISGKASFSTYLITIAKNNYLDYIKKENKIFEELDVNMVSTSSLEEDYLLIEDYNLLLKEINKLPPGEREAIKLKYLEGYTLKEIAAIEKVESKTIKSRLYEGRKKLKEHLKGMNIYE